MSRIIKHSERVEEVSYSLNYYYRGDGGCSFDCNENGLVDESKLQPAALENLKMCRDKYADIAEVEKRTRWIRKPGEMKCDCGKVIKYCPPGDVECPACHRNYNSAGQLLAPRSQWGEETGETAADYDFGYNNPERAFDE